MSSNINSISWKKAKNSELKGLIGVAFDIDDTFSTEGKITREAYEALWRLQDAGFSLVPLTGRCAGWCDHIARFWPVDGVVGENGAFFLYRQKGHLKRIETTDPSGLTSSEKKSKLIQLRKKIIEKFKDAKMASDQPYREFDLAIDFCEDVKPWSSKKINELVALCDAEGAHAKVSSIHVNTWFGDYDKFTGFGQALKRSGLKLPTAQKWIFIGDSPNDEPLFKSFKHSVGVANLKKFLPDLESPPTWITKGKSGVGFVEFANKLILSKA